MRESLRHPRGAGLCRRFTSGDVDKDGAIGCHESLARDLVDVSQLYAVELTKNLVDMIRIVEERPAFRESVGSPAESSGGLEPIYERESLRRARAIQLRLRERRNSRQLGE